MADQPTEQSRANQIAAENRKLADVTSRRIEADIVAAGWPIGTVLGSETDLIRRYEVSRAVFREAVRLVEHHGVGRMRRGPSGGLVVQAPNAAAVISAVAVYLDYAGTSVHDLIHVRRVLEPLAAAMAAKRVNEEDIHDLRAVLEATTIAHGPQTLSADDKEFHYLIANLSGNETLALFIKILMDLTALYASTRSYMSRADATDAARDMHHAHAMIATAVVAGSAATAEHRTDVHLNAVLEFLKPRGRNPRRRATKRIREPSLLGDEKLAEVVARSIRADISGLALPVGAVIGSEAALQEQYGVSRAVLREAVRLLEHHSVAVMRRGPGGGLVVTQPDPDASIEAATLLLQYQGSGATDLHAVREALELAVVDQLAAQVDEPGTMGRRLPELMVDDHVEIERIMNAELAGGCLDQFHASLADLTDNPVLALLLRITLSLWGRNAGSLAPNSAVKHAADAVAAHRSIVAALLDSDSALARHRTIRHLTALTALTRW